MPVNVAIVGAGPAGFYTAEALLQRLPGVRIDFIEKLPTPYGLIRAGVAPDHQTTKNVARKFEQTARRESVQYFGNVEVGRDVALAELRELYDAVVLAVGTAGDRYMGIPGEDKDGVYGSAVFVGWYNGHPDFSSLHPSLDTTTAVIIGNGNVALDVARVLVKTRAEMEASDIAPDAAQAIDQSPLTDVYLLGRRGPLDAKFTNVELRELASLADAVPIVDPADLPVHLHPAAGKAGRLQEKNLATLREFAARFATGSARGHAAASHKRIHFRFNTLPVEILGGRRVEGLRVERSRVEQGHAVGIGEYDVIRCGLVVVAIGYRAIPIPGVPFDPERGLVPNSDGRVAPGLYAVGWAKRGASGVIATNRPDGVACSEQISADLGMREKPGREKPGRDALERLLAERHVVTVSFADWQQIDAAEVAAGGGIAPRRKFTTLDEMLGVIAPRAQRHSGGA
jgi:NADPH-dependent glutamate synthase beta subunit-like oxidoreductase